MNKGPHIDSDLLARYLAGECTNEERIVVEQWVASDDTNAEELELLRAIWNDAGTGIPSTIDVDAAWQKVNDRMDVSGGGGRVIPISRSKMILRLLAAAAVVTAVFVGVQSLMNDQGQELMATTEYLRSTLPDSSHIILAPGSHISVKMNDVRHIGLSGEAYFEVERDIERPFVVETEDLKVTVLGTAFEVSSVDTSNSVLVRVRHGRVQVSTAEDTVILKGGEYARYNKIARLLERMPAPHTEVWGDRVIQFKEAPLSEVAAQLERLYQVRIRLANEALVHCKLTATFDDEPIDYILRVIADTYGFTLTMETTGSYTLDGDGC